MIEDVAKNLNKSLGDNEIASLMKTLASKNYRENVSFPKRVIQPFKPISFLEAANKNLKKNDNSIHENIEEIKISKENPESQIAESENESNDQIESNIENLDELESSEPDVNGTTPKDSTKNELIENEENTATSEIEQITPIGIPVKENLYTKDELSKEYQKGYSEGVKAEQRKFTEEKENLLKNFDNLIKTIEEKIFIDTNSLEKYIKQEIINIASERVGSLIDEMPKEFLEKIKSLSNTIRKKSGKKILKLNPDDLRSIEKIIQNETHIKQFVFFADKSLSRGDYVIEIGEISLEDKINDRYNVNEDSSKYFEIDNNESVDNEMSSFKQNSSQSVQKHEDFDTQNASKTELINDPPIHQEQNNSEIELKDQTNVSNSSEKEIIDIDLNEKQKTTQTNKNDQIDEINDKLDNKDVDEFINLDPEINDEINSNN